MFVYFKPLRYQWYCYNIVIKFYIQTSTTVEFVPASEMSLFEILKPEPLGLPI